MTQPISSTTSSICPTQSGCHFTSAAVQRILNRASPIALRPEPVLILGESGVGKSQLGQWIHSKSKRAGKPFVRKGCGEFDPGTIEATLFGHTKDAYTGAATTQEGVLKQADGGTLLLDDIDYLPLKYQTRLLRFLDDRSFYRLGEPNRLTTVNVRLIVTTNKDLGALATAGEFLPDLLYRLKSWRLYLPPLRERPEDIQSAANHFLQEFQAESDASSHPLREFSTEALEMLCALNWPGNLRQLREAVFNIALFCNGAKEPITLHQAASVLFDPEFDLHTPLPSPTPDDYIKHILEVTRGNVSLASRIVGHSRTIIHEKIKQNGWHFRKKMSNRVSTNYE